VAPYPGAAEWSRRVDELGAAFASADLLAVQRANRSRLRRLDVLACAR